MKRIKDTYSKAYRLLYVLYLYERSSQGYAAVPSSLLWRTKKGIKEIENILEQCKVVIRRVKLK